MCFFKTSRGVSGGISKKRILVGFHPENSVSAPSAILKMELGFLKISLKLVDQNKAF